MKKILILLLITSAASASVNHLSKIFNEFKERVTKKQNISGVEFYTMLTLKREGFDVDSIDSYEYEQREGSDSYFAFKTKGADLCVGTTSRNISSSFSVKCFNIAGELTWLAGKDFNGFDSAFKNSIVDEYEKRINRTKEERNFLNSLQMVGIAKGRVKEFNIFPELGKYVVKTIKNEICSGDYDGYDVFGECLSPIGLSTWHSSSDSD